jgi:hypothetical protein
MEKIEINVRVVRAGTAKGHVRRTLGEGLHRCGADTSSVAVRVAGIEGTIVVEHYIPVNIRARDPQENRILTSSAVDARHIQLIDNVQPAVLATRLPIFVFAPTLALAVTSLSAAPLVIVHIQQLRATIHHRGL